MEDTRMRWIKRAFSYRHIYTGYTLKITTIFALCLAAGSVLLPSVHAQTRIYDFPLGGTCYEVCVVTNSHGSSQATLVPYPFCPIDPSFTPLYSVDDAGICIFCGPGATWSQLQAARDEILYWQSQAGLVGMDGSGEAWGYTDDDFYLELISVDTTNDVANLLLHATVSNELYQLEFKTNLDQSEWTLSQTKRGEPHTNATAFNPEAINGNAHLFFRAHHADVEVSVVAIQDGIEPNSATNDPGQPGIFRFKADGLTNDLTLSYKISGVASNGSDYTNISGLVTIPASTGTNLVFIQPIEHDDLDFDETVTVTISYSNKYVIDPLSRSATIVIHDNFAINIFQIVAFNFDFPTAIDYHPPTRSLMVANNGGALTGNFRRIDTNVTAWATVTQFVAEVKFAIPKQTASGFTNGEIFFDQSDFTGIIGRVASNGASWTSDWLTLGTGPAVQGGFFFDQTGLFGNDLIAVTGTSTNEGASVWRIKSNGDATNLAFFPDKHFEGVITLSNDVARYGPLAGKIVTGSEDGGGTNRNLIRTIDTNGVVGRLDLGIVSLNHANGHDDGLSCEHFDLIPPDQDLYLVDEGDNMVLKLPRMWFTNYVGDLLVTQGGQFVGEPELYILHWNGSSFMPHGIPLKYYSRTNINFIGMIEIEGVTFAPIDVPAGN
jgi:hypothetical protein